MTNEAILTIEERRDRDKEIGINTIKEVIYKQEPTRTYEDGSFKFEIYVPIHSKSAAKSVADYFRKLGWEVLKSRVKHPMTDDCEYVTMQHVGFEYTLLGRNPNLRIDREIIEKPSTLKLWAIFKAIDSGLNRPLFYTESKELAKQISEDRNECTRISEVNLRVFKTFEDYVAYRNLQEVLHKDRIMKSALSKLTPEEKRVLGYEKYV